MVSAATPIAVACAADEGYAPHVGAMLHSLFASSPGLRFRVHFLHRQGFEAPALEKLAALCRRFSAAFTPVPVDASRVSAFASGPRYREEAWYRLILPSVLRDVHRVLWLDADLLVLRPIETLWATDLRGCPLAAVPNALGARYRDLPARLELTDDRSYFNTGVMLMDLHKLRCSGSEEQLRAAAVRYAEHNVFADQDVFNPVFQRRYLPLPLYWNVPAGTYFYARDVIRVHGATAYREAIRHPRIVHFTQLKPWHAHSQHPFRDLYLRHRRAAGWLPPKHPPPSWKLRVSRRLPLTVYTLLKRPGKLAWRDVLIIFLTWLRRPYRVPQRHR